MQSITTHLRVLGLTALVSLILLIPLGASAQESQSLPTYTPEQANALINDIVGNRVGWKTTDLSDTRRRSEHVFGADGRTAVCTWRSSDDIATYTCTIENPNGTKAELSTTGGRTLSRDRDANDQITASAVAQTDSNPDSCSWGNPGECLAVALGKFMGVIVGGLALVLLGIASMLLWIAGGLFNWVVIKTVFEFGNTFGTSEGMLVAWGILRDIGNIVLLFSFIFMGIATILNTHALDEYSARKALPRLIIFAVLLNFSLFAAQFVIDVSNSFAAVFTAQAGYDCSQTSDQLEGEGGKCANVGIAGSVIQLAGVSSIYAIKDTAGNFFLHSEKFAPVYIGLVIFVTITAAVLFAAAIMFVIRAVMLCLLMVLSPIGFAGMAVPPLQEFAQKWWKSLISNAFYAPIYLLLVLISLKIAEGLVGPRQSSFADALINGGMNAPQLFVIFAIVIGFMVASLVVAKQMGAAGADFATKGAGKFVFGTYGFIGRRTAGKAFDAGANAVSRAKWRNTGIGRFTYNTLKAGSSASLSPRALATSVGKGVHLDFGKPNKVAGHGFHGIEEEKKKVYEEYEKKIETTTDDGQGVWKEKEEELKEKRAERKEYVEEALNAVGEQRLAVEKARLSNDQAALRLARAELDRRLYAYSVVNGDAMTTDENGNKVPVDARGYALKKREEQLEKEFKAWKGRADADKLEKYATNLEHSFEIMGPFSPEAHAKHEAATSLRKNANKSKTDKAFDDLKKALKDGGDDENQPAGANDNEGTGGPTAGAAAH